MKKRAFTLAEVLITLGIIGVVAALTMPSLLAEHQKKVLETQLKKFSSATQQGLKLAMAKGEVDSLFDLGVNSDAAIKAFIIPMFSFTKDCTGSPANCFANSYTNLNGNNIAVYADAQAPCIVSTSGAIACFKFSATDPAFVWVNPMIADYAYVPGQLGYIIVDINGKKSPNKLGRDLFVIGFNNDGTLDNYGKDSVGGSPVMNPPGYIPPTSLEKCQQAISVNNKNAGFCYEILRQNSYEFNY